MQRTLVAETTKKVGKKVIVKGWVDTVRDHGKIAFIDLRDRSGKVQVVGSQNLGKLHAEDVVEIEGEVKQRPEAMVNPDLDTGTVEVGVEKVTVLATAAELPLPIEGNGYDIEEAVRLKYRYLDLRRPRMNKIIRQRSQVTMFMRNWLAKRDFFEIETPILTKTTPEGARDFLVPSRLQPGKFYALPQSPQQYKQLLMVAGLERYFQIARCFRDEDPRADRAYGEFTQLDVEMSFVAQEDILQLAESLFTQLVETLFPEKHISQKPWPRISHKEAREKYGSDKPDLRQDKNNPDELAFAWIIDFPLFVQQTEEDFFHGSGSAKFAPSHHMFTAPHPDDVAFLDTNPLKVRGLQHDMVLNGYEVGGGSIRIHQPEIQQKVFDLIGFSKEQKQQFEHMLTAFTYGVPPHGGIASGLDRFLMVLWGEPSVREVMAFPAIASGQTAVLSAPSQATREQLQELDIQVIGKNKSKESGKRAYERIIELLKTKKVDYQVYEHEPVFTSEQSAKVRGTMVKQGAKALVMFGDKKPVMLVLSAADQVDTQAFKKAFGIRDLRMATIEEVTKLTGTEVGAVPPFGNLFNLPVFVEERLGENEEIAFNAGLHTRSIKMKYGDFAKLVKHQTGSFTTA